MGFARSTNGGASFDSPITVPGSLGAYPWDQTLAAGPDGTVYVAFMVQAGGQRYPVVATSFDNGATFPQVTSLVPPSAANWGDLPSLAVAGDGTVYIAWDYGPQASSVVINCTKGGSCSFSSGDLNIVIQSSTDDAASFGPMTPVTPGYPWGGADVASMAVDPAGDVDVLYQDYVTNPVTGVLSPASNFFTTSTDGGATWSPPVGVGQSVGTMSLTEWWYEPSLGIDSVGNLYATWDTQSRVKKTSYDTGWLSYSRNDGATWSTPVQVPKDKRKVPHIMEVVGGAPGQAYVGWLSDSNSAGYAVYLRKFSIGSGWLVTQQQISKTFGNSTVWPGDTFGLSLLDPSHLEVSWGSAPRTSGGLASISATQVSVKS